RHDLEALDVAFPFKDFGNLSLEGGRRNLHALVTRVYRVPDPGQHVCDRVCHLFHSRGLRPRGPPYTLPRAGPRSPLRSCELARSASLAIPTPSPRLIGGPYSVASTEVFTPLPPRLPAALEDAGHFSPQRQFAEAEPAERELPEIRPRPAALAAA